MFCDQCGARVSPDMLHCPVCGYRLRAGPGPGTAPASRPARRLPTWLWVSGVALLGLGLLAAIAGLGVLGVQHGLAERDRRLAAVAQLRYERAVTLADAGDFELALAELDEATRLAPQLTVAADKAKQIRQQLSGQATATIPVEYSTAESMFRSAQAAEAAGKLDEGIKWLQDLRDLYPQYRQDEVAALLFNLAYRRGQELVAEGRPAEAMGRFDDALTARPDDPDALAQKRLASMYLAADSTPVAASWDQKIANWEALYKVQASYRDVADRLGQAYTGKADALAAKGDWCEAQATYQRGVEISPAPKALAKLDLARDRCLATPDATPTRLSAHPTNTPKAAGRFVGQFAETLDIWGDRIQIRGRVLDRRGQPVAGASIKISAFNWSATATTGGDGTFSFDGLRNPVVYTLTLANLPSQPIDVQTEWGKQSVVNFVQQ